MSLKGVFWNKETFLPLIMMFSSTDHQREQWTSWFWCESLDLFFMRTYRQICHVWTNITSNNPKYVPVHKKTLRHLNYPRAILSPSLSSPKVNLRSVVGKPTLGSFWCFSRAHGGLLGGFHTTDCSNETSDPLLSPSWNRTPQILISSSPTDGHFMKTLLKTAV